MLAKVKKGGLSFWYNFFMTSKLVIVRGAPASGKTTIGESLRDFDKKIVWFKTDNVKPFFSNFEDRTLDEVMETCLVILYNLLGRGYSVIYEGIFKRPEYISRAVEIAKSKNTPYVIYQLECSLETLQKRDKERPGVPQGLRPALRDELIESLYNTVRENPIPGSISLNTEEKTLEECLGIIRKIFE